MTPELERPTLEERRRDYLHYLIAVGAIAVATLVSWGARSLLVPDILSAIDVTVFAAAVLITAWLGGSGPGFAATVLGAVALAILFHAPGHAFAALSPRDTSIIVASTALSALITYVAGHLHASRVALLRGLPGIERRARDRANDAARVRIEEERSNTTAAKADVADMQRTLRHRSDAAMTAAAARAGYLSATRQAVRLPLRAAERYADRLSTSRDALTPSQRRDLDAVVLCQEHLEALLARHLEPRRVEAARLLPAVAEVSLSEIVAEACALAEPDLAANGCTVEYENLDVLPVRADATILRQVLARLLLDDVKLGSPRVFRLDAQEREGGVALDCRSTSNAGLTAEAPDQTREETEMEVPGLIAADELVRQMGGRLTREETPGTGLRFTIWLSTRVASEVTERSGPITLWPPIAFEIPVRAIGQS